MTMHRFLSLLILPTLFFAVSGVAGEAPLDPEDERLLFELPEGFEINLYASDPLMAKPIHMNFDPQGRLWVASSETYPQVKPGEVPNDKILILEDTKGVGRADKVTVFADHLFIPTGIAPGDGGAYVANSTQLLHFKDTDGDGKADLKRVVLDGFGTEDTHHILHTLRWGMDGRLFMNQSIYIHSHIETPFGVKRLNAGGTWRFKPDTMELEVFTRGLVNHWGHCFTKWGESLATDGAGGEGVNFFFHGATFCTAANAQKILHGTTPGSPKYAGCELISGRHFPDDWQGDVITNDFRASRIVRFKLTEEGSGFTAKLMPDVIHLKNVKGSGNGVERAFRPIDVKMGPDGALYIADWFNPIIQHGEVDFRDPRRDHTHGRIWRLTAKGRPLVERPKLVGTSVADLLNQFKVPEDYTRVQARRVLIEKGPKEVLPALGAWVKGLDAKDPNFERYRLEGLWLYQAFNTPEPELLKAALASSDPHARAASLRVLRDWYAQIPDALDVLAKGAQDESPRVRLEAITALENIPDQRSLEIALRALDKPQDANLDFALYHAVNGLKDLWLPGVENGTYAFNGNMRALSYALQASGTKAGIAPLLKLLKENKIPAGNQDEVLALVAGLGGPAELQDIFQLQENSSDAGFRLRALIALERSARERHAKPGGDLASIKKVIESNDATLAPAALRLAGALKMENLRTEIGAAINDPKAADALKLAALDALVALGGAKSIATLSDAAKADTSAAVRARAVAGFAALDAHAAIAPAVTVFGQPLQPSEAAEVFAAFAKKEGAGAALAKALAAGKIAPENAEGGLRYFNASGQSQPELLAFLKSAAQANAGGASSSPPIAGKKPGDLAAAMNADEKKSMSADDMKAMMADVQQHGDAARGEKIFRRKTLSCFSCHAIAGAGGQVGPDLSNVGSASPLDYIIDSVLAPNKTVKEGYNAFTVMTKDKEMFTGNIVRQTATHLILRDGTRDEIPIALDQIQKKREAGSLMPNGLADSLTRGEFADLARFLSELGKPGPFSTAQSVAVRRFQMLDPLPEAIAAAPLAEIPKLLAGSGHLIWAPIFAEASGMLPAAEIARGKSKPVALVRFDLDVTTPGKIALRVNSAKGLLLWLDGVQVDTATGSVDVKKGTCAFMGVIDFTQRGEENLKIDVEELPGSPARFQRK